MAGPLAGYRVLELGRILAAPFCAQMLGDMGAEVIKIEVPQGGDEARAYGPPFVNGESSYFFALNRNKESVALNLKDSRGKEIARDLIRRSDVFVHNSVPGSIERLGFSYEAVREVNPRIVYCAISGFGPSGPDRDKPSLDMMAQALSGIMSLTGEPGGAPMRSGAAVSDIAAGMVAAYAIAAALLHRERSGEGQMIDTSILEASISLLTYQASRFFVSGENPPRLGNAHPSIVPYDCYRSADGWVTVAVMNERMWQGFCAALDLEDLLSDERFASNAARVSNRDALNEVLLERVGRIPTSNLVSLLEEAGVPCAEVRDLSAVFTDPQVQHLGVRQSVRHADSGDIEVVSPPYRLSVSPPEVRKPPPRLGEHTEKWLRWLGRSQGEIDELRKEGVV